MSLDLSFFESLDFDAVQLLTRSNIANLKSQTLVDTHKRKRLIRVDRKRTDAMRKWADDTGRLMCCGIGHGQQRRTKSGQIAPSPI